MRYPPIIISFLVVFLTMSCSTDMSGGPGGQTTNGITAKVLSSVDSTAVDSAEIILRPISYIVGDELNSDTTISVNGFETYSSPDGSFEIPNVIPGLYILECMYKDSIGVVETITVDDGGELKDIENLYAERVGSLKGQIDTTGFVAGIDITVFARGFEKSTIAKKDGSFKFEGLANWTYEFVANIEHGEEKIEKKFKAPVSAGENKELDTINLYAPFNPFQYLAVREFLNNMSFFELPVDSVVRHVNGQIHALWMPYLEISSIHFTINKINFVDTMNFEHNNLVTVPAEIGDLDSVKVLLLGENDITSLPDEISGMANLFSLHIVGNSLDSLPLSLEGLLSLKDIHICHNNFTVFPEGLTTLPVIESICLDNNKVESLPLSIGNLSTLKILDLESNNITALPVSIVHLTELLKIDIDSNMVSFLPEAMMDSLINLETMELIENRIDTTDYSDAFIEWLNGVSDYADWIATQKL